MNISAYFFLPVLLSIGILTTHGDFVYSKIKNRWIVFGILYAFVAYFIFWILSGVNISFLKLFNFILWRFDKWCVNLIISSLVGYLMWHFNLWSAGDAKLFICYAALIPMGQYHRVYFNYYFASFALLGAIFIPAAAFILLKSLIHLIKKIQFSEHKKKLGPLIRKKLSNINYAKQAKIAVGFFVYFLFIRMLNQELRNFLGKMFHNQNVFVLISLLLFQKLSKFFKKFVAVTLFALVILLFYWGIQTSWSWNLILLTIADSLGRSLLTMILFGLSKMIIDIYIRQTKQQHMPFAFWMFLGALIVWFF